MRLYSRPGNDLTRRFPLIIETLARLRSRSCIIDGEAVACETLNVRATSACAMAQVVSHATFPRHSYSGVCWCR